MLVTATHNVEGKRILEYKGLLREKPFSEPTCSAIYLPPSAISWAAVPAPMKRC